MEQAHSEQPKKSIQDFEPVTDAVLKMLPEGLVRRNLVIPLSFGDGRLIAGVPDLGAVIKPEGLRIVTGCPVEILTFPTDQIAAFIKKHYPSADEKKEDVSDPVQEAPSPMADPPLEEKKPIEMAPLEEQEKAAPLSEPGPEPEPERTESEPIPEADVVKESVVPPLHEETKASGPLAEALIALAEEAVRQRAHEVLIRVRDDQATFRYQIRGVWVKPDKAPEVSIDQIKNVMAAFSNLKTARRVGNAMWSEGEKNILVDGRPNHCRFVVTQNDRGALISLRTAPRKESLYDPRSWGMDNRQIDTLAHMLRRPRGLVAFCGANDEDVKEVLYGSLRQLSNPGRPGILVEDEEEEWFPDVDQFSSALDEDAFSALLESSLEQAPSLIGVSPLEREKDVLRVLQACLRRHMALARVFADDAAELLYELSLMKIDNHLLGTALNGIVTVRAIRYICQKCVEPDPVGLHTAKEMGIPPAMQPANFFIGRGCSACQETGFDKVGRIFEIVEIRDNIRRLMYSKLPPEKLRAELKVANVRTLRQVAIHKAINGQTSLGEVLRVARK